MRRAVPGALVLGWVALASCQAAPKGVEASAPRPRPSLGGAPSGMPNGTPAVTPVLSPLPVAVQADPKATLAAPSLPLRFGVALPRSLVGSLGQARLSGEGGLVALEGTRLELQPGGALVANHGGSVISNNGGGIVSNNSGSLVGAGGGFRTNERRLLQEEAVKDRRFDVWGRLVVLDLTDQLLQAYAKAGPQLGRWRPFTLSAQPLPPPDNNPLLVAFLAQLYERATDLPYTGLVQQEGQELHLWMMRLPGPGAKPSDGEVALELLSRSGAGPLARFAYPPEISALFGVSVGAMRMTRPPTGGVQTASRDRTLPWDQIPPAAQFVLPKQQPIATHRNSLIRQQGSGAAEVRIAEAKLLRLRPDRQAGPWARRSLVALGFAGPGQEDAGVSFWERVGQGPLGAVPPLDWVIQGQPASSPEGLPPADQLDAQGRRPQPLDPKLLPLLPSWRLEDEGLIPELPALEAGEGLGGDVAPSRPPDEVLALP